MNHRDETTINVTKLDLVEVDLRAHVEVNTAILETEAAEMGAVPVVSTNDHQKRYGDPTDDVNPQKRSRQDVTSDNCDPHPNLSPKDLIDQDNLVNGKHTKADTAERTQDFNTKFEPSLSPSDKTERAQTKTESPAIETRGIEVSDHIADAEAVRPMMMPTNLQSPKPILPYPSLFYPSHPGMYSFTPSAQIQQLIQHQGAYPFFQTSYYPSLMLQQPSLYGSSPPISPGIPLSLPNDAERLSAYQTLLRQQFEFFQAGLLDAQTTAQGRKRPVAIGQVGIRCRHCLCMPLRSRGRGSVYFPSSLTGIYQAGQNMAGSHLSTSCPQIPAQLKRELEHLRNRRDNANGGKHYWADGARALGIYEDAAGGLRWSAEVFAGLPPTYPVQPMKNDRESSSQIEKLSKLEEI